MTILQEILEWSKERPAWQRDALRLLLKGELSDDDICFLVDICKGRHGLTDQQTLTPLSKEHIPKKLDSSTAVSLVSIFHHHGVNSLAENQTLKFGTNLTVVYGDNGAGKTGYIRILKSACRTRGQEEILGNVVSGTAPLVPDIAIRYKVGAELDSREWSGNGEDDFISRVSVFDTQCASVYLTEKTDVAFRPFGLDLFDKLVKACKAVRTKLEAEQHLLASSRLVSLQAKIPQETAVASLITGISSLTKPETVCELAKLSAEEEAQLALLERSLLDLQVNDPEKLVHQLDLRVRRTQKLAQHLKKIEETLSPDSISVIFKARTEEQHKSKEAKQMREEAFSSNPLTGTGSETWKKMWEAARLFSQEYAYPNQKFPVTINSAYCVLCQQKLDHTSADLLKRFENFIISTLEQELQQAKDKFEKLRNSFSELTILTDVYEETLREIRIENEIIADTITEALVSNKKLWNTVVLALTTNKALATDCPALVSVAYKLDELISQIQERIETLKLGVTDQIKKRMMEELQELRARKLLARHKEIVLEEIERKKKYAAYALCIDETKTRAITQKSTSITRSVITQRLKNSFQDELNGLQFKHIEVELKEMGGSEGVLYHKLVLKRAPGVKLPKVVSEGEQRCLSIAAFFAELSTSDDPSGIIFDDPMSSLDYKWRENIAERLVQEAKTRQVIVFSHDVVFLLLLKQYAEKYDVKQFDQHVRHLSKGAGVCIEELPWVALKVSKRIRHLNKLLQDAKKLYREGHELMYEREAGMIYGLLREAWERGLEEVLLGSIVERYRPSVQTLQVAKIADITSEDCGAVQTAMTKCSRWLHGHDQAAAARANVPEPAELESDIKDLDDWVKKIRQRRE